VSDDPIDYLSQNVALWESVRVREQALAERQWTAAEPNWGIFSIPESVAGLLPDRVDGWDTIELGCGTGYVSSWLARRGARPVGVDPTPGQLQIARRCQGQYGLSFPLVRAAGEQVPLRSGSFDLAISEYGAAIWADPYRWIPEAARLLRDDGELVFLGNSSLLMLCVPDDDSAATERMLRPQFGMHRFEWNIDRPTTEFHLSHGDWIRLLRYYRFEILELIELRPPEGSITTYEFVTSEWADKWPCEEVWRARKQG
jgi:SAM-dependent methyltransferase